MEKEFWLEAINLLTFVNVYIFSYVFLFVSRLAFSTFPSICFSLFLISLTMIRQSFLFLLNLCLFLSLSLLIFYISDSYYLYLVLKLYMNYVIMKSFSLFYFQILRIRLSFRFWMHSITCWFARYLTPITFTLKIFLKNSCRD